jgi:hypothetical protein
MKTIVAGALCAALFAIGTVGIALGDDDEGQERHEGHERHEGQKGREGNGTWMPRGHDLAPVANESYRTECGGCHFAYQPGLLPADAWRRLMGTLDNHFGDDATLDPAVNQALLVYLTSNSADGNASIRSRAFAAKPIAGEGPPRITKTVYFQRKHDEVPARMVKDNPKVGSFSNCAACHQGAEQGDFSEGRIDIPGVGRWED